MSESDDIEMRARSIAQECHGSPLPCPRCYSLAREQSYQWAQQQVVEVQGKHRRRTT